MIRVRPAAVAGFFYPAQPSPLAAEVDQLLAGVTVSRGPTPKALVVPHAGYRYSGPIAATAYDQVFGADPLIRRVVLLGPSHRVPFRGLALPEAEALATPLGELKVDADAASIAARFPQVVPLALAHAREHSLEVQLPFLQRVLPDVAVLPLVVGHASAEDVSEVLEALWGDEGTLLLVSSDLSHYLPSEVARQVDGETAERIVRLEAERLDSDMACGAAPLRGLLLAARRKGLTARQLDLRNSGDTSGEAEQVVGYGAFGFYAPGASA